mgnify:CR=1 FL=1
MIFSSELALRQQSFRVRSQLAPYGLGVAQWYALHTDACSAGPVALAGLKGALEPEHPHYRYGTRGESSRGRWRSDRLVDCTGSYTGGNCSSQNPTSFIELKRAQACVAALRPPEIAPSGIAADERRPR